MKSFTISPLFTIEHVFTRKNEFTKRINIIIRDNQFRSKLFLEGTLDEIFKFIDCIQMDFEFIDKYSTRNFIKSLVNDIPLKIKHKERDYWISSIKTYSENEYNPTQFDIEFTFGIQSPSGKIMAIFRKIVHISPPLDKKLSCDSIVQKLVDNEDDAHLIIYNIEEL